MQSINLGLILFDKNRLLRFTSFPGKTGETTKLTLSTPEVGWGGVNLLDPSGSKV